MTLSVRAGSPLAYSVPPSCPVGSKLWSLIDWNAHLLAVVTDVVQPLLPRSSFWTTTVCVSMQKQTWIAVTSHACHKAEIRQSACLSCREWSKNLAILFCYNCVNIYQLPETRRYALIPVRDVVSVSAMCGVSDVQNTPIVKSFPLLSQHILDRACRSVHCVNKL